LRTGNPSILTAARPFDPGVLDRLLEIELYADRFLTPEEARRVRRNARTQYFEFMGRSVLKLQPRAFWQFHFRGLRTIGWNPPYLRIAAAALWQAAELILNPLDAVRRVSRAVRARL
jgi:hypothetical protein